MRLTESKREPNLGQNLCELLTEREPRNPFKVPETSGVLPEKNSAVDNFGSVKEAVEREE